MADEVVTTPQTDPAPQTTPAEKPAAAEPETDTLLGTKPKGTEPEAKPKTEEPAKVIPEKYEIKTPEGMTLDQGMMDALTPVFKEAGITQEIAQKLADAYAPQMQKQVEAVRAELSKSFKDMVNEWGEQSKKELGADFAKKLSAVSKLMDQSKVEGIRELFNETGIGNHPTMIKFMSWVADHFKPDSFPEGKPKVGLETEAQMAEALYPSMKK